MIKQILKELREHIPFTLIASLLASVVVMFYIFSYGQSVLSFGSFFEIIHPLHIVVSASASAAIYYKYKKSIFGSVLIGILGAILIGSLSDVLLPYLGGNIFNLKTQFHLPLIESPLLIFGSAVLGAFVGVASKQFRISHVLHVFLSVAASLFYLLAFSAELSFVIVLLISGIVFLAVFIPCCISDIIFPLVFVDGKG